MDSIYKWLDEIRAEWDAVDEAALERIGGELCEDEFQGERYYLYIPDQYSKTGKPLPLLVLLHGCAQQACDVMETSKMNWVANQEGFMVLYPDPDLANPLNGWDWWSDCNLVRKGGEPEMIAELVRMIGKKYNVDSDRIFAAGISAGGAMSVVLAVTYPDIFSGIGICAGLPYRAACGMTATDAMEAMGGPRTPVLETAREAYALMRKKAAKPVPVIIFHGEEDSMVSCLNADNTAAQWRLINGLIETGQVRQLSEPDETGYHAPGKLGVTRWVYEDDGSSARIEKWMIAGMDHEWPGGMRRKAYSNPQGPPASAVMWRFFSEQTKTVEDSQAKKG